MAKLTTEEFIAAIKELSVLELNDLVKACEEEFGVSAAAGVVVAAAGAAEAAAMPPPTPSWGSAAVPRSRRPEDNTASRGVPAPAGPRTAAAGRDGTPLGRALRCKGTCGRSRRRQR